MSKDTAPAHEQVTEETPLDDPRNADAESSSKQTDTPWKGLPEKEQFDKDRAKPDLEKWKDTNTH